MFINFECVVCKQVKLRKGALCSFCYKKVKPHLKIRIRETFGVKHYYLFNWSEEADAFIRPLVYFLKGRRRACFDEWAEIFKGLKDLEKKILVCPPASAQRQHNQAESFACSISQLFSSTSVLSLEAKKGVNLQKKSLKKEERFKKNWLKNRYIERLKKEKWVFVDDVLVSGSTLKSLIETHGLPEMVLTLIYRPLIGEDSEDEENSFYDDSTNDDSSSFIF